MLTFAEKSDSPHRVLTLNKYSLTDYGIDKVVNILCLNDDEALTVDLCMGSILIMLFNR